MTEEELNRIVKNIKYMMSEDEYGFCMGWDPNVSAENQKILDTPPYRFLRKDKHLKSRVCYLTIAGSKAYGTDTPESDTDIRGVTLERPEEIYGSETFEQFEDKEADTVIYGLKKFVSLCKACNPNRQSLCHYHYAQYAIRMLIRHHNAGEMPDEGYNILY